MSIVYFNNLMEMQQFKTKHEKQLPKAPLLVPPKEETHMPTRKEKRDASDKSEYNTVEFFKNIKDKFIDDKKNKDRKKIIKELKEFIKDTYKNKDLVF